MEYKEKVIALLNSQELSKEQKEKLENIFPELKESDGERIVKCLLNYFNHVRYNGLDLKGTDVDEVIAWLEKQGEFKSNKWTEGDVVRHGGVLALVTNGRKAMKSNCEQITIQYPDEWVKAETKERKYFFDELEKQGEKKPVDKVEPKFKVGDWISDYYTNYKVMAIHSKGYVVEDTDGNKINILFKNEKFHHLFTIVDAKNGDVLVASDDSIFLFAGIDDCACKYYAALTTDNYIKINKEVKSSYWETSRAVYPATKNERDLLFQVMKEAGYEWDNEKKELKKIEPKTLDADKVIAWLVANICDFEYYVTRFKKDFGL